MSVGPLGLAEAQRLLAAGEATPREILDRCLSRLGAAQASGAFVVIDEVGARREATRLRHDATKPLLGVPVAVKDLVDVAGLPTGLGRSIGRIAAKDAAVVARLRAAGAVIVGKTRTDELGLGTLTAGAADPRDPSRSVGGSSGGSAIAVAVGAALLAVATDTAGSARIPAAACGVTGLCPPADWVSHEGVTTLSPTCDRVGLVALGPSDMEAAWRALGGAPSAAWSGQACVLSADALGRVEPDHAQATAAAARRLDPSPAVLPGPAPAEFGPLRAVVVTGEAARLHRIHDAESPLARAQLEAGAAHDDAALAAARHALESLGRQLREALGDRVLVTPTVPGFPPRWDELIDLADQLRATGRLTRLCGPVNTSGLVAISVPFGVDASGRPGGVQLIARRIATVLAAASRLV